jgi:hypothetical protein
MNGKSNLVGQWYLRRDMDEIFQVTGYDERSGTIEIQTFDGDLDEIEEDVWRALPLAPVEAPKDWSGSLDHLEQDDADASGDEDNYECFEASTVADILDDLVAEEDLTADDEFITGASAQMQRVARWQSAMETGSGRTVSEH